MASLNHRNSVTRSAGALNVYDGQQTFMEPEKNVENNIRTEHNRKWSTENQGQQFPNGLNESCKNTNYFEDGVRDEKRPRARTSPCRYNLVVLLIVFLVYFNLQFPYSSLSVLYVEYVNHFQSSVTVIGFLPSVYCGGAILSGLLAGGLSKRFGARSVALTGSLVSSASSFVVGFCTSVAFLVATYAIFGFGAGLMFLPASSSLQQHFTTRRTLATAISICGFGVGNFIFPPLTRYICDVANWRFASTVMSCFMLQTAWLFMLLRPKKRTDEPKEERVRRCGCLGMFVATFGFHLLKKPAFVVFCLANILYSTAVSSLFIHIVNKAIFDGTDPRTAALLPSVIGISLTAGQLLFGFLTIKLKIKRLIWYGSGCLGLGLTLFLMKFFEFMGLAVCNIVASFSMAMTFIVQHTLVVDLVGIENVFQAMGILMFSGGVGQIVGPPLSGFLYDFTQDYDVTFAVLAVCSVVSGILAFLDLAIVKNTSPAEVNELPDHPSQGDIKNLNLSAGTGPKSRWMTAAEEEFVASLDILTASQTL